MTSILSYTAATYKDNQYPVPIPNHALSQKEWDSMLSKAIISKEARNPEVVKALIESDVEKNKGRNLNQLLPNLKENIFHYIYKVFDDQYDYLIKPYLAYFNQYVRDDFGDTPVLWAIANANNKIAFNTIESARAEKEKEKNFLNVQSNNGNTPLILAVAKGYGRVSRDGQLLAYTNLELVQELIKKQANVNLANQVENTALHYACIRRDQGMIEALLQAGADRTVKNDQDQIPQDCLNQSYKESCQDLDIAADLAYLLDEKTYEDKNNLLSCQRLLKETG